MAGSDGRIGGGLLAGLRPGGGRGGSIRLALLLLFWFGAGCGGGSVLPARRLDCCTYLLLPCPCMHVVLIVGVRGDRMRSRRGVGAFLTALSLEREVLV